MISGLNAKTLRRKEYYEPFGLSGEIASCFAMTAGAGELTGSRFNPNYALGLKAKAIRRIDNESSK